MFPKLQYQAGVRYGGRTTQQIHSYAHFMSFALQGETSIESTTQVDASQRGINLCSNRSLPRDSCMHKEFMEDNYSRLRVPLVTSK